MGDSSGESEQASAAMVPAIAARKVRRETGRTSPPSPLSDFGEGEMEVVGVCECRGIMTVKVEGASAGPLALCDLGGS